MKIWCEKCKTGTTHVQGFDDDGLLSPQCRACELKEQIADTHTGQATKAEQVNSFIGEKFAGAIVGVLPRDIDKPIISDGSITLVFECGWGIVLQDVKKENIWVENPEIIKQATQAIMDYAVTIVDNTLPAHRQLYKLTLPPVETTERSDSTGGITNLDVKPEKPKKRRKKKTKKRIKRDTSGSTSYSE